MLEGMAQVWKVHKAEVVNHFLGFFAEEQPALSFLDSCFGKPRAGGAIETSAKFAAPPPGVRRIAAQFGEVSGVVFDGLSQLFQFGCRGETV